MIIILAILMVILSDLPSDFERSCTYYYRYNALMSFTGGCFMALLFIFLRYFSMLHWIECFLAQHIFPCKKSFFNI